MMEGGALRRLTSIFDWQDCSKYDKSSFRNRSQNQVPQPIRIRDAFAIRPQRFYGRVHTQVALRSIGVLPALMPVNRRLNARITHAKQRKSLRNPLGFANPTSFRRVRELARRPFGDHDWLMRVEPGYFLVGPVHQRRNIRVWFVLILLSINAQAE